MMDDQIKNLIDGDVDDMDVNEQRRQIKEIVNFGKFVPTIEPPNPCETTHNYFNPGIDLYCNYLNWDENGWEPIDETEVLQEQVPEYMPTDEAIETMLQYQPILEIGAGSGYWANTISTAGGQIIATDYLPPNVPYENLPDGYMDAVGTKEFQFIPVEREEEDAFQKMWSTVHIADHSCVQSYPSHTVFMCHPPVGEWTEEVLDYCHLGQELILVGEWFPGADGTPNFFRRLAENWELLEEFPVYDWASMHTGGYIFRKVQTE